jgi:hypothetical protein
MDLNNLINQPISRAIDYKDKPKPIKTLKAEDKSDDKNELKSDSITLILG